MFAGCCWRRSLAVDGRSGASRGHAPVVRRPHLLPAAPGICPLTARSLQGMAPYPGQARCLALGFWPECFRRLDVKGGRRTFPKETRRALDIEGKYVTIQGPSPALTSSVSSFLRDSVHVHRARPRCLPYCSGVAVMTLGLPPDRARGGHDLLIRRGASGSLSRSGLYAGSLKARRCPVQASRAN